MQYSIALVGAGNVGKTSYINAIKEKNWIKSHHRADGERHILTVNFGDEDVKLTIFDFDRKPTGNFDAYLVMYDDTEDSVQELKKYEKMNVKGIYCCNKIDKLVYSLQPGHLDISVQQDLYLDEPIKKIIELFR